MGSYQNIHLGPYIIVNHKPGVRNETRMVCVNIDCTHKDKEVKTNFCATCGTAPQKKKFEVPTKINSWSFLMDKGFENSLISVHAGGTDIYKDKSIMIPNHRMPDDIDIDSNFVGEIELLDQDLVKRQLVWFEEKYKEELKVLRENFGEIEPKWGLVIHYS